MKADRDITVTDSLGLDRLLFKGRTIPTDLEDAYKEATKAKSGTTTTETDKAERGPELDKAVKAPEVDKASKAQPKSRRRS